MQRVLIAESGGAFRFARMLRGVTRRALAAETGVRASRIVDLELGRRRPRPDELRRLWEALTGRHP